MTEHETKCHRALMLLLFLLFMISVITVLCSQHAFGAECGNYRWDVKTLQDIDAGSINFESPVTTTIHELVNKAKPYHSKRSSHDIPLGIRGSSRQPAESVLYLIKRATFQGFKEESDHDYHLVIGDPQTGETMVMEIPDPNCAHPKFRSNFQLARLEVQQSLRLNRTFKQGAMTWFSKPLIVDVEGVGFFDSIHGRHLEVGGTHKTRGATSPGHWVKGETGAAPNGIELHPVLRLYEWR
jgi:hypothetical protein